MTDRRYGFMFQPPVNTSDYNWLAQTFNSLIGKSANDRGIKVLDLSEVPGDVLPIVAGVFARLIYDVQFWMKPTARTPVCLVCDEAHLYLPVREDSDAPSRRALEAFERIAKEGRKYGVALLVVSQRPSDVSRTILSQCNNFVALRLTNEQDQSAVKSVMPDSMSALTAVLPLLDIGEALVLGDAVLLPSRVKLNMPKLRPLSLTRNFWSEWNTIAPQPDQIEAAVEALRRQSRS
jgi:DNA helicase HerA-like ATPase